MPIFCILKAWNALALKGLGNYSSGLVLHLSYLSEHHTQHLNIRAIHHLSIPPKGFTALLMDVHAVLNGKDATVEDGHEIIQIVVRTESQCLLDRVFPRLAISQETEHP